MNSKGIVGQTMLAINTFAKRLVASAGLVVCAAILSHLGGRDPTTAHGSPALTRFDRAAAEGQQQPVTRQGPLGIVEPLLSTGEWISVNAPMHKFDSCPLVTAWKQKTFNVANGPRVPWSVAEGYAVGFDVGVRRPTGAAALSLRVL